MSINIMSYTMEIEWQISWFLNRAFPNRTKAPVDVQRTRAGRLHHTNTEGFEGGYGDLFTLPMDSDVAGGQIDVRIDEDTIFLVNLFVGLGATAGTAAEVQKAHRKKFIIARPGIRIPFMVNAIGRDGDPAVAGTALSLHGVITTGNRAVDTLGEPIRLGRG